MPDTSLTLLNRLRSPNDQQAWSRFVELYTPILYQWARAACLAEADARDLLQDLFLLLFQKLPEFAYDESKKSFRGWLRTVATNKLRERFRRRREVPLGSNANMLDTVDEKAADRFWEVEYRDRLVRNAMEIMQRDFEPTTWKACWETAFAGRPAAVVSAELGISVGAVYVARSRVLRRLREEMAEMLE